MVELYAVNVPLQAELSDFSFLFPLLSKEKRCRIARFVRKEDALRGLFGEWLIRSVAAGKCGMKPEEFGIGVSEFGKPYFSNFSKMHFNLSHAGTWVLAAFADEPVGVDVEEIRPIDLNVASIVFSEQECSILAALPPEKQLNYFFRLWTLKESLVKALGKGFGYDLRDFSFTFDDNHYEVRGPVGRDFSFRHYDIGSGYASAACCTDRVFADHIEIRHLQQ
ncbi:MAG: 4'-phosphopantetheinyl transferase superfamily protein [Vulcanimicrobiota bacterium]